MRRGHRDVSAGHGAAKAILTSASVAPEAARRLHLPHGDFTTLRRDTRHARRLPGDGRDVVASPSTPEVRPMTSELLPMSVAAARAVSLRPTMRMPDAEPPQGVALGPAPIQGGGGELSTGGADRLHARAHFAAR
jgi:hypothetical protein